MPRATVVTDASYCPNKSVGGWAAWIRIDDIPYPVKGWGTLRQADLHNSTYAEMYAALNGAWLAAREGATEILIVTDCMAVIHLLTCQSRSPDLFRAWCDAIGTAELGNIELRGKHVKAHRNKDRSKASWVNDWADKHSRKAMREARGGKTIKVIENTSPICQRKA